MSDVPTPTRPDPGLPEKPARTSHRRGFIAWLRDFLSHVPQVPRWQYLGVTIFFGAGLLTVYGMIDANNDRDRARDAAASAAADYEQALTSWNQAQVVYTSCLESVARSDGNRAWKTWLLNKLEATFPESAAADSIVEEGRQKLDELLPARTPADCMDPGPPPIFEEN